MASKAENKATNEYRKRSVRQVVVRFYPKDGPLYDFVKSRGGSTFLKELAERERLSSE